MIKQLAPGQKVQGGTVFPCHDIRAPFPFVVMFHSKAEGAVLFCISADEIAIHKECPWIVESWIIGLVTEERGNLMPFVFRAGIEKKPNEETERLVVLCTQRDDGTTWRDGFLADSGLLMENMIGHEGGQRYRSWLDKVAKINNPEDIPIIAFDIAQTILLTFKLLSTKNIVTCRQDPPAKLQKSRKKKGKPELFSWHELAMESKGVARNANNNMTGQLLPLHWVRGHFKEYTQDKPLFGNITGRYWWQPHLAGKETDRFVEKTYVVSTPHF